MFVIIRSAWLIILEMHFAYLDRVLARFRNVDQRSVSHHEPLMGEYLNLVFGDSIVPTESGLHAEDVSDAVSYWEGSVARVPVNRFERDRRARDECLRLQGRNCVVCGMSFGERYGPEVKELIHVHHVVPLAEIRGGYSPNPASELVPICPNCHAVIHARGGAVRSIEEVREMLRRAHRE